jgi:hypothetical protein
LNARTHKHIPCFNFDFNCYGIIRQTHGVWQQYSLLGRESSRSQPYLKSKPSSIPSQVRNKGTSLRKWVASGRHWRADRIWLDIQSSHGRRRDKKKSNKFFIWQKNHDTRESRLPTLPKIQLSESGRNSFNGNCSGEKNRSILEDITLEKNK